MSSAVLKCDVQQLEIPSCERGIGSVILQPDAAQLIAGVHIEPYKLWPDDRGYFLEVLRTGQGMAEAYPRDTTQISAALSYPGTIKAFHYHQFQTDVWVPAMGMFQIVLVDLRRQSSTFGVKNTIYAGALRTWQFRIPPGVGHGYKVLGNDPAMLIYATDRFYDPTDEGRIAWNNALIQYDWDLQHK